MKLLITFRICLLGNCSCGPILKMNNFVFILSLSAVSFLLLILILVIAFYKILGHCKRKKNKKQDDSGVPEMSKSTQDDDAYSGNEQYVDFGCLGDENEHQYSNTIDRENQLRNDDASNHEYVGLSSNREPEDPYQSLEILNDGDPESSDDYYEYPD